MNKERKPAKIVWSHASDFFHRAEYAHRIVNLLDDAVVTESISQVL